MQSMIITPKPEDPEVQILTKEFVKRGYKIEYFIIIFLICDGRGAI